jgi:hypothetical protein
VVFICLLTRDTDKICHTYALVIIFVTLTHSSFRDLSDAEARSLPALHRKATPPGAGEEAHESGRTGKGTNSTHCGNVTGRPGEHALACPLRPRWVQKPARFCSRRAFEYLRGSKALKLHAPVHSGDSQRVDSEKQRCKPENISQTVRLGCVGGLPC